MYMHMHMHMHPASEPGRPAWAVLSCRLSSPLARLPPSQRSLSAGSATRREDQRRARRVACGFHHEESPHRKGRCVSDPCAILTVRCSARAARRAPQRTSPRAAAGRAPPSTPCGARSVPHRASTARREGWTADAEHLRGAHLTARPRGRAARAEHLTVSIAHGSLTHRPFLA